jgi:hypothetical protein
VSPGGLPIKAMRPASGNTTQGATIRQKRVAFGDRVAVFGDSGGRPRRGLVGTVMFVSTRLGQGTTSTVLLDEFTEDQLAVVQVPLSDLVVVQRRGRK